MVLWKGEMNAPFGSQGLIGPTGLSGVLAGAIRNLEGSTPPPPPVEDKRHKKAVEDPGVSGLYRLA